MKKLRISAILQLFCLGILSGAAAASVTQQPLQTPELQKALAAEKNQLIFENIYGNMPPQTEDERPALDVKAWRACVKEKMGMNVFPHLRVSLDRVKSKSSSDQQSEIIALESHLAPKGNGKTSAKGYGLAFKVKLD